MLKEEALEIKKHLNNDEFLTFTASNGWLEKWKISYDIREKRVNGEAGEVSGETVNAWMLRGKKFLIKQSPTIFVSVVFVTRL